jgi:predicted dehydrogenase
MRMLCNNESMTMEVQHLFPEMGVAFVGGGFMSGVHARAARASGARLVGVTSRFGSDIEAARNRLGAEIAYPTLEHLLADERVDIVHVCSPNRTHADITRAVLASGKHVICEKPLATSAPEASELAHTAAGLSVVAAVPFIYRFHPMVREARVRIRRGDTGRIFSVSGSYLQDWLALATSNDWRVDPAHGGPSRAFADIGSHLTDLIEFVTGDQIARVCAQMRTVHPDRETSANVNTEDVVTVLFETSGGVIGTLHVSQVAVGHKNGLSIEINGERESLIFDQETPDVLRVGTKQGFLSRLRSEDLVPEAARYSLVPAGHAQGYQDAFNAFVLDSYRATGGDVPEGLPTFADGYRAASLTDAVLRSHHTSAWVETPNQPGMPAFTSGLATLPTRKLHG